MMVTPSIRLVLVLTYIQVFILLSAEGLSLSLITAAKCESFTKKSPKPKAECPNDSVTAENSKLDKPLNSTTTTLNSARNSPVINAKEALCLAPVIPKCATLIKSCPNELPISGALSLSSNPFGLKLPVSVLNTVASLPCPNLKSTSVLSSSGFLKAGAVSTANMALEDCVSASTVQSANLSILANSVSTNSGLSFANTCGANAYSPGFRSSLTVSSMCSNVNSTSSNPSLGSKCENHNTNVAPANNVPGNLDLSSTRPQSVMKQDVSPSSNQIVFSNSAPSNLPITLNCANNMGSNKQLTQSCLSNNLPVSQTCNVNIGSNSLPITKSCPINQGSNNLPVAQSYPKSIATNTQTCSSNVVSSIVSSCQSNIIPNILPVTSNSASNNLSLTQPCPKNVLPQQQDCLPNVGSNLPVFQGCSCITGANNIILSQSVPSIGSNNLPSCQSCSSYSSLSTPLNTMSPNSGTGLSSTPGINTMSGVNNNFNSVSNFTQNTLCNPSPTYQTVSESISALNFMPENQYPTVCALNLGNSPLSSSNIGSNLLSTSPQMSVNKLISSVSTSHLAGNSVSTLNTQQNFPCITSSSMAETPKSDGCLSSITSQQNYSPGLSINANNIGTNCQINQTPFYSDSTVEVTPHEPTFQDAIIYPTMLSYPPPQAFPITNPFIPSDQIPVTPIDPTIPNASPMTPISRTSINEYFKGVKAATSKLNDFISSFSNKFGIKSFPAMQSYPSMPSETLSQPNTVTTQFPEDKRDSGLPSYNPRPTATFLPALQPNIFPCRNTVPLKQECSSSCTSTNQDTNQPEALLSSFIQPSCNNTASVSSYSPATSPILTSPTTTTIPQTLSTVTFKAPVIPKTIVTSSNYPTHPLRIDCFNVQNSLSPLSCNNNLPILPLPNLPAATPSNLMSKLNFGSYNSPGLAPITPNPPNFYGPSLASIINSAKLTPPSSPNAIVSAYDDVTNILIPDVLSAVLSTKSCPCEICKKALPFLSSISINTSPDCNSNPDCLTAMSNTDECSIDLSSVHNSCLSSDLLPSLDESQLGKCCKNLENIIAMLELSLSLNGGFDCDLDLVPDILSTL